jgi:hypothetical protein
LATWSQVNSGVFGKAEVNWLKWVLRGDAKAAEYFKGGAAKADGWQVKAQNLASIKAFPPY